MYQLSHLLTDQKSNLATQLEMTLFGRSGKRQIHSKEIFGRKNFHVLRLLWYKKMTSDRVLVALSRNRPPSHFLYTLKLCQNFPVKEGYFRKEVYILVKNLD